MRRNRMAYLRRVSLVLLAVSVVASACKEEDKLAFKTNIKDDNLCNEVAEVMCYNIFECCRGQQIEQVFGVKISTSETDCRRDMELVCQNQTSILQYAVDDGRVTLAKENIEKCVKAYKVGEGGCFPNVTSFAAACDAVLFRGNQNPGQRCLHEMEVFECAGDAYCGPDRKCQLLPVEGEPCNTTLGCARNLFCGPDPDDETPEEPTYICQARKGPGEDCGIPGSSVISECADDALCWPKDAEQLAEDATYPGICVEKKALGDACDSHEICNSGKCLPGSCDGEGVCFTDGDCMGTCRDSGQDCSASDECNGTCETSGATCNVFSPCNATCRNSGAGCASDDDCPGACAESGAGCATDEDCNIVDVFDTAMDTAAGTDYCVPDSCVGNDPCIQNDACEGASECVGRVCALNYFTADYCTNSLINQFVVAPMTPSF